MRVPRLDESITLRYLSGAHLPLWPVNGGKPGSDKSVEFMLPLAVKSRRLLSHKSQSVTRERSYAEPIT